MLLFICFATIVVLTRAIGDYDQVNSGENSPGGYLNSVSIREPAGGCFGFGGRGLAGKTPAARGFVQRANTESVLGLQSYEPTTVSDVRGQTLVLGKVIPTYGGIRVSGRHPLAGFSLYDSKSLVELGWFGLDDWHVGGGYVGYGLGGRLDDWHVGDGYVGHGLGGRLDDWHVGNGYVGYGIGGRLDDWHVGNGYVGYGIGGRLDDWHVGGGYVGHGLGGRPDDWHIGNGYVGYVLGGRPDDWHVGGGYVGYGIGGRLDDWHVGGGYVGYGLGGSGYILRWRSPWDGTSTQYLPYGQMYMIKKAYKSGVPVWTSVNVNDIYFRNLWSGPWNRPSTFGPSVKTKKKVY